MDADGFVDPGTRNGSVPSAISMTTRVTVSGSDVDVDFADVSSAGPTSINSVHAFTSSYVVYALKLLLVPNVPQNGGFLRPSPSHTPERSWTRAFRLRPSTARNRSLGL